MKATVIPPPGTIGLSRIAGALGWWISAGQALSGDPSQWTHAFVVLDQDSVIEASPKGARRAALAPYLARDAAVFLHGWPRLDDGQVAMLREEAERLLGTPYSFLDYVSLIALALRIRPAWLREYVAASGHMICSQLVDHLMCQVGAHLFDDGRPPQGTSAPPTSRPCHWPVQPSRRSPPPTARMTLAPSA